MNMPPRAANNYTTEQLLELALAMLDNARREQNDERMPIINKWLTDNFTLELIRAKVASDRVDAAINPFSHVSLFKGGRTIWELGSSSGDEHRGQS
jgi:hypothetical protein